MTVSGRWRRQQPGGWHLCGGRGRALRREPSLLRVPQPALHANLAWLLPMHQEFGHPKDELWQQHGPQWIATLAEAAGRNSSFRLRFRRPAATNSAVTTVADEPNRLSTLRRELMPLLRLPGSGSAGDLVHITLFRYARSPWHPPARPDEQQRNPGQRSNTRLGAPISPATGEELAARAGTDRS